ncbi:MAG TPA: methionyl-tRNA formyltransferase [Candidatus Kapabacteria bacterium]|nr:methionyl-tRNA formyltransferase [Candidatus Kapabacteria bacterium]
MPRIVFFGTAELACASLEALLRSPAFQVIAVVSQPDKPRGRDLQLQPSPVKATALCHNIPVLQPKRARSDEFIQQVRDLAPDLSVVVAYGQILPQPLLDVPKLGSLNVHTSILPKHRGAAPIQSAILSGDPVTGVTIMKMDAGLDTGPILSVRTTPIADTDNSQTLHDRLADLGAELLVETIPNFIAGSITPQPQPEGATYARKIEKSDGLINWQEPAAEIWRKLRAFTPWPGAFTYYEVAGKKRMLKILEAVPSDASGQPGRMLSSSRDGIVIAASTGSLRATAVQPEGRKRMTVQEFLAGNSLPVGQEFTR